LAGQTRDRFALVLSDMGSDVTYHREDAGVACTCRTPEGFRDPAWHAMYPLAPICNEQGFLTTPTEFALKASIQPAFSGLYRRSQRANDLLGDVERDDMLGILPVLWSGHEVDLEDWSEAGEDYLLYDGHRYVVVAADKVPDVDGQPHHWEAGLRRVKSDRVTD
jgi:hypothetical protein